MPLLALAALTGLGGVALGAFGGHGLRKKLADAPEGPRRLEWWQTGSTYHQVHALAIAVAALTADRVPGAWPVAAAWAFFGGVVLFSGSLYVMALTGVRKLGAITPLGGLGLLAGWACLLAAALAR